MLPLLGSLAGCLPSGSAALRAVAPVRLDTLFYVSARAREAGKETARLAEALEFGLVITAHPRVATDPDEFTVVDSVSLTRARFAELLRDRTRASGADFAVLYTHGYGTSLHESWEHTLTSRARAGGAQPWIVFSWPSIGSGVAWPRVGEILTSAYRRDSSSVVASRDLFAEALQVMVGAVGGERLMVVAHSMGGQLLGETMVEHEPLRATLMHDPLRAVAFVSPDIAARRFTQVVVPELRPLTQRLLLYASSDDRVLTMSRLVNESARAGLVSDARVGPVIAPGLESIDMTDGAYADSPLVHMFGTRHALRRKRAALFDLVHVVGSGRAAACRQEAGTATLLPTGAWRLEPVAIPDPSRVDQCSSAEGP